MTDFFRDRTVLVTGASAGIGEAMARRLAPMGARLVLVARSADTLDQLAGELRAAGGDATPLPHDLGTADAAETLATRLDEMGIAIDVLINNAGYGIQGPFLDHSAADAEGMVMLNALALTGLTSRLLPGMVERGRGGVLNVASLAAFVPAPRFAVYAATKAYVLRLSEALHAEMDGTGVHVSCLCPGPVRTSFAERAGMDEDFFKGAVDIDKVVTMALEGLAANKRRVLPGAGVKVQAVASRFAPTGFTMAVTEAAMRKAG